MTCEWSLRAPARPIRRMVSYYGGKYGAAKYYPPPAYPTVVEPFAGGAGYSLWWGVDEAVLIDKFEKIVAVWEWLIAADPEDILALPMVDEGESVDDYGLQGARRWFVGWWLSSAGVASPVLRPSKFAQINKKTGAWGSYWSPQLRAKIARDIPRLRRWAACVGDYRNAPDIEATWFIDPPYQEAGRYYPRGSRGIDYADLAEFCRTRRGQVIVCENEGADWLPFQTFRSWSSGFDGAGNAKSTKEVIWTNDAW